MSKFQELKYAVKNPPAIRLAAIEYKSHFLQMLGIVLVSIILIYKGFWYIIFALIFQVGISYAAGMSAYRKYKLFEKLNPQKVIPIDKEISPSRRRDRIIKESTGAWSKWIALFAALIIPIFILDLGVSGWERFFFTIKYIFLSSLFYIMVYYFGIYFISNMIYNMKGGKKDAKEKD